MKQPSKSSPKFEPITAADAVALAVKTIPIKVQRHIMGEIHRAAKSGGVSIRFNCREHDVDANPVGLWLDGLGYSVDRHGIGHTIEISWGQ